MNVKIFDNGNSLKLYEKSTEYDAEYLGKCKKFLSEILLKLSKHLNPAGYWDTDARILINENGTLTTQYWVDDALINLYKLLYDHVETNFKSLSYIFDHPLMKGKFNISSENELSKQFDDQESQ